jgi:DNA topoisomerase I
MASPDPLFKTPCRYVDDCSVGYSRVPWRGGFRYVTMAGKSLRAAHIVARLDAIALPPAYSSAWYCRDPHGHLQATGIDAKGRRQYRYHPAFRADAESAKFAGLAAFGAALPAIRRRVESGLSELGATRNRVISAIVRLLDIGHVRVGNASYARANKSFGATTLRMRHAHIGRDRLRLEFVGKSGKAHSLTINDRRLIAAVRACGDLPGHHLFQYVDDDGARHSVDSGDVNAWLRDGGADCTAKMFRTWHASVMAFGLLVDSEGTARMKAVMESVAAKLGNTPTIARKSYVHPALVEYLDGTREWAPQWSRLPRATIWLTPVERGLLALLADLETQRLCAEPTG